ncbi:recombinase family protein [Vibrio ulleungensis]|uniref:Recombinase family protein n=1 Tax=Vibrio ulleungensis TaxID=2807619 RepID=A0ABS2HPF7_9VIBR|nr:recombinase family protein [Vibrio ulleungensis]MBM7038542.1 recombinase family protein [Vibrio ulleungensis]
MKRAFLYLRFSSATQAKGHSYERQHSRAVEYCQRNNLDLQETTYEDLGISAFKGSNLQGSLGRLLEAINVGVITQDDVILVENLDRISRQEPTNAMSLFSQLLGTGIPIVTLTDGQTHSKQDLQDNPYKLFVSIAALLRAYEESKTKSIRLKSAWEKKHREAKQGVVKTKIVPSWLKVDNGKLEVIPSQAESISYIFHLASSGKGCAAIASQLNREKIPPLSLRAKHWHSSFIARLLNDGRVIGRLTPFNHNPDGTITPDISRVIENYYPQVIPEQLYYEVQAAKKAPTNRAGRKGANFSNLLQGCAYCQTCGGKMSYINKGAKNKRTHLQCSSSKLKGCSNDTRYEYSYIEGKVLNLLYAVDLSSLMPTVITSGADSLQSLVGRLAEIEKKIDSLIDISEIPQARDKLIQLGQEQNQLKSKIDQASEEAKAQNHARGITESIAAWDELLTTCANGNTENRIKLNGFLRNNAKFIFSTSEAEDGEGFITTLITAYLFNMNDPWFTVGGDLKKGGKTQNYSGNHST